MNSRRSFLIESSQAFLASAIALKADPAHSGEKGEWRNKQSGMAYRRLGRTGFMISEVVMGGNTITPESYEHVLLSLDMGPCEIRTSAA